jgi:Winged helix DNA-binding domain
VIGSGGLAGKQQTYALLDERVPAGGRFDRDDALVELVRRYLTSHGPATMKDMSWWSGLTMADLRKGLEHLGEEVRSETLDGMVLWSIASDDSPPPAARGAHLLQTYDELVVGYTQSRFFGNPGAEKARAAWSDRTYPSGVLLLNGLVGGHWRRTIERTEVPIELHLYQKPKPADTKSLEAAAARLGRFLGLPVTLDVRRF